MLKTRQPATASAPSLLDELSLLASERSGERRRELLSRVAELFYTPAPTRPTDSEQQLFAALVDRLLRDVETAGRAEFSQRAAHDQRTPRAVALTLAGDAIEVARPVLEHSPSLLEGDLVAIATSTSLEHRMAISRRQDITELVSDALIRFGELEVAEALTENTTASISENGFARIGKMAWSRPSLRRALSAREDLPLAIANDILPYLEPAAVKTLLALLEVDGVAELQVLIKEATPRFLAERTARAQRRIKVRGLLRQVTVGKAVLDEVLIQVIDAGYALDLALALSIASGLPEQQVANAIISVRQEPLAIVCRSLGVPTRTYISADALRTRTVNLPNVPPTMLKQAYEALTPDIAARSLRFVKVRNAVAGGAEPEAAGEDAAPAAAPQAGTR